MEYYLAICPSRKEEQIEFYRCEPHVYSQMTAGRDAPTPGEAKNAWLTGTAAWSFVAISQFILGITPTPTGLRINPCIPRSWKSFRVTRKFRGKTYKIECQNPNGASSGVRRMTVDGIDVAGDTIPVDVGGNVVHVSLELG